MASEDKRFFRHRGVDLFGLGRAVLSLGRLGGGSTITQQLAKNVALSHSRTLTRKAVELVLAMQIERKLRKREILEAYMNSVYWGHGVWGIAGAAAVYFRKKPAELAVEEAALLAAILPAPEHLSPFRNPEGALRARASVLQRMLLAGYISPDLARKVAARGLPKSMSHGLVSGEPERPGAGAGAVNSPTKSGVPFRAPFFVAEVLYQLRDLLNDNEVLRKGGLQIHTTLDLALQERAEQILQEDGKTLRLGEDKGEAALVAMEPTTGAVRVLVGGRSYMKSTYNRAMLARSVLPLPFIRHPIQPNAIARPSIPASLPLLSLEPRMMRKPDSFSMMMMMMVMMMTTMMMMMVVVIVFRAGGFLVIRRQPGSAFKPIVYLAALATGLVTPRTEVEDEEVVFRKKEGGAEPGWLAISKKDQARMQAERRLERRRTREQCAREIRRLQERDVRAQQQHGEDTQEVRRKLVQAQRRIAEYESEMDEERARKKGPAYIEGLLAEAAALEDKLLDLEDNPPGPDPAIAEMEAFLAETADSADLKDPSESDNEQDYMPQNYNRKYAGANTRHRPILSVSLSLCLSLSLSSQRQGNWFSC